VRIAARNEVADRARSQSQGHAGQRQTWPRWYSRSRVYRAGVPADSWRPGQDPARTEFADRVAAYGGAGFARGIGGHRTGTELCVPARCRASLAGGRRPADAEVARRYARLAATGVEHGLPVGRGLPAGAG